MQGFPPSFPLARAKGGQGGRSQGRRWVWALFGHQTVRIPVKSAGRERTPWILSLSSVRGLRPLAGGVWRAGPGRAPRDAPGPPVWATGVRAWPGLFFPILLQGSTPTWLSRSGPAAGSASRLPPPPTKPNLGFSSVVPRFRSTALKCRGSRAVFCPPLRGLRREGGKPSASRRDEDGPRAAVPATGNSWDRKAGAGVGVDSDGLPPVGPRGPRPRHPRRRQSEGQTALHPRSQGLAGKGSSGATEARADVASPAGRTDTVGGAMSRRRDQPHSPCAHTPQGP